MAETLTILVTCYNNEDLIRDCLESAKWADDLFVVDSYSTDDTLEIVSEYTDHVLQHRYDSASAQRNWAIPQITATDWVMVLDSDERISPELAAEIQDVLKNGTEYDGFTMQRRTTFFGKLIKHCGWQRDWIVRLWRNGKGRYTDQHVHTHAIVDGPVGKFRGIITHHTYDTFEDYFEKFGRYTTWGARDLFEKGRKATFTSLTFRPMWRFFRAYVIYRGFLDGYRGLILCGLAAFNVFVKYAKLWDMRRREAGGLPPEP